MHDTRYRFHGRANPKSRPRTPVLPRNDLGAAAGDTEGTHRLYLYDPIDSWGGDWGVSAKEVLQALADLPDGTNEVRLHINSPGGEVFEGIAIMNALRNHPVRVVAVVDGLAASAASFIAAGADEVIMGRNTELMIHDAWGIAIGPAEDMHQMGDRLDALSNNIASVYQGKAGGTLEDWRAAMLVETWYPAEDAVAAGLADSVQSGDPAAAEAAKASYDLAGMFKNRAAAGTPPPAPDYTPPPIPVAPPAPLADPPSPEAGLAAAARFLARQHAQRERALAP